MRGFTVGRARVAERAGADRHRFHRAWRAWSTRRDGPAHLRLPSTATVAGVLLASAACGSASPTPSGDDGSVEGTIVVFAAASLTDAFEEVGAAFEEAHDRTNVEFSFGGSSALVEQVRAGAPADVVATADAHTMAALTGESLVTGPQPFASSSLAIVVPEGNPDGVRSLDDLEAVDATTVICAPEVPCGRLALEAYERAGLEPHASSLEANVRSVLTKVRLGEADAGLVYVTDALAAADEVDHIELPAGWSIGAEYVVAPIAGSQNAAVGQAFAAFLRSDEARAILRDAGFTPR